jgi:hypothetical protein
MRKNSIAGLLKTKRLPNAFRNLFRMNWPLRFNNYHRKAADFTHCEVQEIAPNWNSQRAFLVNVYI